MLLPWIEPERVVESTTVVASFAPFQRMTALEVKFAPTTFMVTALEPAAIVCGRTALMLGALKGSTTVLPQPSKERPTARTIPKRIALNILKTNL